VEGQQGQAKQNRENAYREQVGNLRRLLQEEKYGEVMARGGKLQRENPKERELGELIELARKGQVQQEQKRRRELLREKIEQGIRSGKYREAIQTAGAGLKEFPQNKDLKELLEEAKGLQAEKEKRELLDKKLKEIKVKINRDDLNGAIELARQTLNTVGPDQEVSRLLDQAEAELEHRELMKRDQEKTLQFARTMIEAGNFAVATSILERGIETELFSPSDPVITEIRREIDKRQAPPPPEPEKPPRTKKWEWLRGNRESHEPADSERSSAAGGATEIIRPGDLEPSAADRPQGSLKGDRSYGLDEPRPPIGEPAPHIFSKNPAVVVLFALLLVGGVAWIAYYFKHQSPPGETPGELMQEQDLLKAAEGALDARPHRFADSLATYQKLFEMHKSLEKEARAKVLQIEEQQKQENDWMAKAEVARKDATRYKEAREDYQNAKAVDGDREKEAQAAIDDLTKLMNGESAAQIARENFNTAETLFAQRQWERAKTLYQQVKQEGHAPPDLRK